MADPFTIAGTAASVIPVVEQSIIARIKPHINRALRRKRYRGALEEKVKELTGEQERLKGLVDEAGRKTREINQQVHDWRTLADRRMAEDEKILEEYEERAKKRCCIGLCPNFKARYQLNKRAEEDADAVGKLINEAAGYDTVDKISHLPPPAAEKPIDVGDYEAFQSRESIVQQIVDDLTVSDKSKIGVSGMGGIGKTTLARLVASQVKEKKSFDKVVFCKVTAVHNIANIQQEIIDNLGLEIKEPSQSVRASLLLEKLEKMLKEEKKKILFVLDDLWKKLDLKAVGIPSPEKHKGCRILMTSRHGHVLSDEMSCGKDVIRMDFLTEEEAWKLFKKMTGNSFDNHEVLQSKAKEVANACARLPVAIITVASALKNKTDLSDWNNALLELQRPSPSNFRKVREDDPTIEEDVHKSIYLSYKLLATEELQSIFLLCSQMVNDSSSLDMLKYSMGLRLFPKGMVRKVEEAQERIRCLVRQLQASCLLLDTGSTERIALHDVVRVIAQAIGSVDHGVFTRSLEDELRDWPGRDCRRMWLRCKITDLPQQLDYPQLQLLHIDGKSSTDLEVPHNIFKGRQQLRVLAFTNFSVLRALPSSLRLLKKNLRTLCLEGSSLEDAAIIAIGKLENLEVLSLAKSKFRRLPIEIGDLNKLKILDLSDCSELEVVPANVISRLSLLEELYMGNSFSGWEKGGGANASLAELRKLSYLTNLEIAIPDAEAMVKDLFSRDLKRYRVTIGSSWRWKGSYITRSKMLKLELEKNIDLRSYGLQVLLKSAEVLHLEKIMGIKNSLHELNGEGFPNLKDLYVEKCCEIEYIIDTTKVAPSKAFPVMESLFLHNLDSLKKICHGEIKEPPFPKLTVIHLESCCQLKSLFSMSIAQSLSKLQTLGARSCKSLEAIVVQEEGKIHADKNEESDKIGFSELRTLHLSCLPELKSFYYKLEVPNSSARKSKQSTVEPSFSESLFNEKSVFPKLEELYLEAIHMKSLWPAQLPAVACQIQKLRILNVDGCDNLKYLFTSSMVGHLAQLQSLWLCGCKEMEDVIVTREALGQEGSICENEMEFPKLEALYLIDLPKLERCYSGNLLKCPLLQTLTIEGCSALGTFVSDSKRESIVVDAEHGEGSADSPHANTRHLFDEKVVFPSLVRMDVYGVENMEKIWHCQLQEGFFSTLRSIDIGHCKKLMIAFPPNILRRFEKLEKLTLEECPALEKVFDLQGLNDDGGQRVVDYQLREIILKDLQKLSHIWNKDPQEIFTTFRNLQSVKASGCSVLKSLFPYSMGKDLILLKSLKIKDCEELEEIAASEEKSHRTSCSGFPNLTSLNLRKLPKLKSFYPLTHISECPELKELEVVYCGAANFFSLKQEVQALFTRLETLRVEWRDATGEIAYDHDETQISDKLKVLELNFHNESNIFPAYFLKKSPNLETLIVSDGFFEEMFLDELSEAKEKHTGFLMQLKGMKLSNLPKLMHLMREDTQTSLLFNNLRKLLVSECSRLNSLVPSSVSFQRLKVLAVSKCHGLRHLLTSSTAKYMVHLMVLWVIECKMIEVIVENKANDVAGDEFAFSKLKYLILHGLPTLTSFYTGDSAFTFSSLKGVLIGECPKMQSFSQGIINAPKLKKINLKIEEVVGGIEQGLESLFEDEEFENDDEDNNNDDDDGSSDVRDDGDWYWEGSLNKTIQELYNKKGQVAGQSERSNPSGEQSLDADTTQAENEGILALIEEIPDDLNDSKHPAARKDLKLEDESIPIVTTGEHDTRPDAASEDNRATEDGDSVSSLSQELDKVGEEGVQPTKSVDSQALGTPLPSLVGVQYSRPTKIEQRPAVTAPSPTSEEAEVEFLETLLEVSAARESAAGEKRTTALFVLAETSMTNCGPQLEGEEFQTTFQSQSKFPSILDKEEPVETDTDLKATPVAPKSSSKEIEHEAYNQVSSRVVAIENLRSVKPGIREETVAALPAAGTSSSNDWKVLIEGVGFTLNSNNAKELLIPSPPNVFPTESQVHLKIPTSQATRFSGMAGPTSSVHLVSRNLLAEVSSITGIRTLPLKHETTRGSFSTPISPISESVHEQRKALRNYFNMSLEDIQETGAFDNIERISSTLIQHSSSLQEREGLKVLLSRLEEFKKQVKDARQIIDTAEASKSSHKVKTMELKTCLVERQDQLSMIEAKFSDFSEEEAKLEIEIQRLTAKKKILLDVKNSIASIMEKTNEEVAKAVEEWQSLEEESRQADNSLYRGKEMLMQANSNWSLLKQRLGFF